MITKLGNTRFQYMFSYFKENLHPSVAQVLMFEVAQDYVLVQVHFQCLSKVESISQVIPLTVLHLGDFEASCNYYATILKKSIVDKLYNTEFDYEVEALLGDA